MNRRQRDRHQGHEYVLERLSPYMDEQLQVRERARVEAHLSACQSCRDELRTLQWTKGLLHQAPPVPLPRSFVIREADLAPQQARRWTPAFALQWATALVTLLLVVVVAGDLFLGGRLVVPGGQEVAMQSTETSEVLTTVVVESETAVEAPAPKAAQGDAEAGAPAEGEQRMLAPTTTAEEGAEASRTPAQAQTLEKSVPVTDTINVPLMMVQGTPEKNTPQEEAPVLTSEGAASPTEATPEQPAEKVVEPPEETPLALAAPPAGQVETLAGRPLTEEPSVRPLWVRAGWRVAEVGLGLLLIGLIVGLVWARRRNEPAA